MPSPTSPFWSTYAGEAIPDAMIEAARGDGASVVAILFRVRLPMIGSGTITVLRSPWSRSGIAPSSPSSSSASPSSTPLGGLAQQQSAPPKSAAPGSLLHLGHRSMVAVMALLVVFVLLQNYWQGGLAAEA